jgi:FkbM family methyltransferase
MTNTTRYTIMYVGNFRPPHSTENHVSQALRNIGHDVIPLQEDDAATWDTLRDARPDLVLWTRTWSLPEFDQVGVLDELRAAGVPTVGYHLDRWWGLPREHQVLDEPFFRCDVMVTADGGHDEMWDAACVTHWWFPPAVLAEQAVLGKPVARRRYPVGFVGSWHRYHPEWPWRTELIRHLRRMYGREFVAWPQGGQPAVRGPALADVYASIDVVVGDSCLVGEASRYWSDRIPETLGRGGFLIHPYVEGIEDHYTDGEHLVLVEPQSWPAMRDAIEKWRRDPDGRAEIAAAGRAHVLAHHTYEHRMTELVERLEAAQILTPFEKRSGPVVVSSRGLSASFDLRPESTDGTVVREVWHENVYGLEPADVEGKVVLDVGANVGAFSVWAALHGALKVIAVEPEHSNVERLYHHMKRNAVDLVMSIAVVAVSEEVGPRTMTVVPGEQGGSQMWRHGQRRADDDRGNTIEVETCTLGDLIADAGGHVDVLKIDIEGSEYEVLTHAAQVGTLAQVDRIVGEWHPWVGDTRGFGDWFAGLLDFGRLSIMGHPDKGGQFEWKRYGA